MRHVPLLAISAIALLASCREQPLPTAPGPTHPTFTTYTASASPAVILGAYNSSNYTISYGINDLGVISGVSDFSIKAVRWETGVAAAPSSTTPLVVDGSGAIGRDINAVGQVAGEKGVHAALWTPDGIGGYTLTDIGGAPLFFGAARSAAYGLNASGQVVGNYGVVVGTQVVDHCFLWTPSAPNSTTGTAVELPGLGGNFCVGNDINTAGQVAGTSTVPAGGPNHAVVWIGGSPIDLQPGTDESYGSAINDAGQVAGFHTAVGSNAAVWTPSGPGTWGTAFDLVAPALSGQSGAISSAALDIDDAGFVVGYTRDATVWRAFFWQNGTFTELPDAPTVQIVEATAMTNLIGNLVVVTGADIFDIDNNYRHGLRWAVTLSPVDIEGCLAQLAQLVADLQSAGVLNTGEARSLLAKVNAAKRQADQGKTTPAKNLLNALISEVNALRASGRLTNAQAQSLIDAALCAIAAL